MKALLLVSWDLLCFSAVAIAIGSGLFGLLALIVSAFRFLDGS
jgi:hypothetical protein